MPKLTAPVIENTLDLCLANGEVARSIPYRIDAVKSYEAIIAARAALAAAAKRQDTELVGKLFIELIKKTFGESVTSEIMDFYGNEAGEMQNLVWMMTPILLDEIFPALEAVRDGIMRFRESMARYGS